MGFDISISNGTSKKILYNQTVNFNQGWLDLSFDVSGYAGSNVTMRAESFDDRNNNTWNSEWAAVDYFYITNSSGKIVSTDPFFDNGWNEMIQEMRAKEYNPYVIMDFAGYEGKLQDFIDYFSDCIDGIHMYNPLDYSNNALEVYKSYHQACELSHSHDKIFIATLMPGFNNTAISGTNGSESLRVIDRRDGTCYNLFWQVAESSYPDGYAITSFNEWHEGTEVEPSIEYGYQYLNLTREYTARAHDVAVANVMSSRTVIGQGFSTSINVTVANQGDFTETLNITAYANTTSIASQNVTLSSGHSTTVPFTWNTTGFPMGNYMLSAYAWPVPGETYEVDNNCTRGWISVSLVGDITGLNGWPDGTVDRQDVGLVANYFGQTVPFAPSNCDLTGPTLDVPDGKVDITDVATAAKHYGEHYP